MAYTTIEEYNTYLVENQININIIDFVKEINKLEFKIDISFIDEFIELVSKNECCIHHNMLQKYGISNLKGGTSDIKKILEQNEFIEKEDFDLRKVSEVRPQGGTVMKNEYYLHPRAFKICLMRSLKTKKYAKYYLLLEECIKYFNDYQIELNKKYIIKLKNKIIKKDHKIDHLEEKLNTIIEYNKKTQIMNEELIEQNNKTHKMNEELLKSNKSIEKLLNNANYKLDETLEQLDEVHEQLENTHEELEETNDKLDNTDKYLKIVANKLDIAVEDRVVKTKSKLKNESFIVMYNSNKSYKYQVIKSKNESLNSRIEKFKSKNYEIIKELSLYNVPNASILWCLIKEELKSDIDYCGSRLNLININESQFNIKINEIYNKRKTVVV